MIKVNSNVKLDFGKIQMLTDAQIKAMEMTAEALHTEVVQAQVIPRDTGNLQNESMFLDCTQSHQGVVTLASTAPYARRLYFHPEYHFKKDENPNARGKWYEDWLPAERTLIFAQKRLKGYTGGVRDYDISGCM